MRSHGGKQACRLKRKLCHRKVNFNAYFFWFQQHVEKYFELPKNGIKIEKYRVVKNGLAIYKLYFFE